MSKSGKKDEYVVGYGKPPAEHRFRKGRSGNPKGRPRKSTAAAEPSLRFRDGPLSNLMEQEAFRSLQLQENGKAVEMTAAQAILRSIMVDGVKGNRLAKKSALELMERKEREAFQRQVDRYMYFAKKKAEGEAEIARCKKLGLPPPRSFPHPDDILLDDAKLEAHLLGPISEDDAIRFERGALIRDWAYARTVFLEKYGNVKAAESKENPEPSAEEVSFYDCLPPEISSKLKSRDGAVRGVFLGDIFASMINNSLPPSFQRSELSTISMLMELQRLGKKQLLQRMRSLMTQIKAGPKSIQERLVVREAAMRFVGLLGEGMEKLAADLIKKERQHD